jgi:hypothetical protein
MICFGDLAAHPPVNGNEPSSLTHKRTLPRCDFFQDRIADDIGEMSSSIGTTRRRDFEGDYAARNRLCRRQAIKPWWLTGRRIEQDHRPANSCPRACQGSDRRQAQTYDKDCAAYLGHNFNPSLARGAAPLTPGYSTNDDEDKTGTFLRPQALPASVSLRDRNPQIDRSNRKVPFLALATIPAK